MKKLLGVALDIGEQMILCGAEVHRVEDTLTRICTAFGASKVDVFIITTSMLITIHDKDGFPFTQTRRIQSSGTDFNKLSKLNGLSRKICATKDLSISDIELELNQIVSEKPYNLLIETIFYALIAWSFTIFFGGTIIESIVSLLIGASVRFIVLLCDSISLNKIFTKFISCFFATLVAFCSMWLSVIDSVDTIIIGNIMVLIPGIGLTVSLRDLFTGDSLSGILRLIEASLTAIAIALGYILFVVLSSSTSYVGTATLEYPNIVQVLAGTVGTIGFGIMFNIKNKQLFAVAVGGFIAWALYLLFFEFVKDETVCYFIVSLIIAFYSELMARVLKCPTTVFITPSLVPLIPGASLYNTMTSLFGGNTVIFAEKAVRTLSLAAALAFGVIVASAIMNLIYKLIIVNKRRKNNGT